MNHVHPTMQQALAFFQTGQFFTGAAMSVQRVRFTQNPAFPHPDQEPGDAPAWPLSEAIAYALKVLKDPKADQFSRNYAATELEVAWINHEEQS